MKVTGSQLWFFLALEFLGCLVEKFESCCLSVFDICVGEKMYEKMCNVV